MGVYIKGMEMPENCADCNFETEMGFCRAMPLEFCEYTTVEKTRPRWCPLTEIPEEHVDLIFDNGEKEI